MKTTTRQQPEISRTAIKTLNQFLNEPNELKRYVLLQLWINQQFNETIQTNIVKPLTNKNKTRLSNAEIYNILRSVKDSLKTTNDNLRELELTMNNQLDVIRCLNGVLTLDMNSEVEQLNEQLTKIKSTIVNNEVYITKIDCLSENQIEHIRNNNENNTN